MEQTKNAEEPVWEESEDNEELVFSKTSMDTCPAPDPDPAPENLTFKQKVIYYSDRVFFCFLVLLLVVLSLEIVYKIWYITNWTMIFNYLRQLARYLAGPEEQEEMAEL